MTDAARDAARTSGPSSSPPAWTACRARRGSLRAAAGAGDLHHEGPRRAPSARTRSGCSSRRCTPRCAFYPAGQRRTDRQSALTWMPRGGRRRAGRHPQAGMASYVLLVDQVCEFMREQGHQLPRPRLRRRRLVMRVLGDHPGGPDPVRAALRPVPVRGPDSSPRTSTWTSSTPAGTRWSPGSGSKWAVRQVGSHMKYAHLRRGRGRRRPPGSLRVRYYSTRQKRGSRSVPWRDMPNGDKTSCSTRWVELKLISGYGTHAAGYIVAPNERGPRAAADGLHRLVDRSSSPPTARSRWRSWAS